VRAPGCRAEVCVSVVRMATEALEWCDSSAVTLGVVASGIRRPLPPALWAGVWGGAAKLVRACGGCLGAGRLKGATGGETPGGAVKWALIPGSPSQRGELKHLSTPRKGKKPRLRQ
jgi:hypothetical protein